MAQYSDKEILRYPKLPEDYPVNYIASSFIETVDWWISHEMQCTPEQITEYFLLVTEPVLK